MLSYRIRVSLTLVVALGAAACASLPQDRGYANAQAALTARGLPTPPAPGSDAATELRLQLNGQRLSLADAQRLAFAGNPRMQVLYAQLGLAGAEVLDAARLANPHLSASFLDVSSGGSEWTLGLSQPFTHLLLRPLRKRVAAAEFERAQIDVAHAIQSLGYAVEQAWWRLIGAEQVATLRSRSAAAAALSSTLAERYHAAGNISDLQRSVEATAAAEAELARLAADAEREDARAELNTLMGLQPGAMEWQVPDRLPLPVAIEDSVELMLELAAEQRLDLAAALLRLRALEDAAGTAQKFRWLGDVEVGVERARESDGTRLVGPTFDLQLPFWHRNEASVLRARAEAEIAQADAAILRLEMGNQLARLHRQLSTIRTSLDLQRTRLLPLHERLLARTQERVNFMFEGPFELLRVRASGYDAYQRYLETLRDYWLTRAALSAVVGTTLPSSAQVGAKSAGAADLAPSSGADPHAGHQMPEMDAHAGHAMPATPPEAEPTASADDPHAGHVHAVQDPHASHAGHTAAPAEATAAPTPHEHH